MHMEKVLEIVWKYSIFTDYLNNNDAFSPHMNWDQFINCLHNFCVEHVSHIRPPMDEPPAPATPPMLTAYNNQHSSNSTSSNTAMSNDNNSYFGHLKSYLSNAFTSKQTQKPAQERLSLDEAVDKLETLLCEEVERKCLNPDRTFKSAGHRTLAEVSRQLRLAVQDRNSDFKFLRDNIDVLATSALSVNVNKFLKAGHLDLLSKNGTVRSLPELVETMVKNAKRHQCR